MSQENTFVDPRSNIEHTLDAGQVYEDSRTGEEVVLVYLSEEAVLLTPKEDDVHYLEDRDMFDKYVGSGRYSLQSSDDAATSSKVKLLQQLLDRYKSQDGRTAAHKAEAIEEALELVTNNGQPDDNETIEFESVDGIGSKAAKALRANGFTTKGDVRSVDASTIEDVPYMGAKNTEALIESVNHE